VSADVFSATLTVEDFKVETITQIEVNRKASDGTPICQPVVCYATNLKTAVRGAEFGVRGSRTSTSVDRAVYPFGEREDRRKCLSSNYVPRTTHDVPPLLGLMVTAVFVVSACIPTSHDAPRAAPSRFKLQPNNTFIHSANRDDQFGI
jgi:hypothetical protein